MQVLLINQNATIERLVKLSSGKLGYELTSAKDISEVENSAYSFIIMDSDLYSEDEFGLLKEKFGVAKYILILTKGAEKPDGFDVYIEKPFLPTELVDIFSSLASSVNTIDADAETQESDVFGDDESAFAENESDVFALEDDAVFDMPTQDSKEDVQEELGDFGSFSFEEEKEEPLELDDLELSLDDEIAQSEEPTDEFQINLDEQIGEIAEQSKDIDFGSELDSDIELDTLDSDDMPKLDEDIEMEEELLLEDTPNYEDEVDMSTLPAVSEEDPLAGMDEMSFEDDDFSSDVNMPELSDAENDSQIFDEDEVNKLKNLLDETEEDKLENEDFDLENIKIHNDELGSLTEESLAEALGVNIESTPVAETDGNDIENDISTSDELTDNLETNIATIASSVPANAIQLNPNQSITISLDALKELLNMADVTINITLSKKQ